MAGASPAMTQGKWLDMAAVFALADRITVLVRGRVIASGSASDIRANPEVRQAYLGDGEEELDLG